MLFRAINSPIGKWGNFFVPAGQNITSGYAASIDNNLAANLVLGLTSQHERVRHIAQILDSIINDLWTKATAIIPKAEPDPTSASNDIPAAGPTPLPVAEDTANHPEEVAEALNDLDDIPF
jgi:hypothetical protein